MLEAKKSTVQPVLLPVLQEKQVQLFVKREDLLHPHISGNKYRKLFYNLIEARKLGHDTLLTFGGAFSNHIAATAAAGKEFGFKTIGVIRGEEFSEKPELIRLNPTLSFAQNQGMQLFFVPRKTYRQRNTKPFQTQLKQKFGRFYPIPQGGTNLLGVKGAKEILQNTDINYHFITVAVGTGGTMAGLIEASRIGQTVLGFPALKENFLHHEIKKFTPKQNGQLIRDYHFGGFAKINRELIDFINVFYEQTHIPLDPVYTGKMLYGVLDMINKNYFRPGTRILAVHTGGLQGNDGMNFRLKKKNLPPLQIPSFY